MSSCSTSSVSHSAGQWLQSTNGSQKKKKVIKLGKKKGGGVALTMGGVLEMTCKQLKQIIQWLTCAAK